MCYFRTVQPIGVECFTTVGAEVQFSRICWGNKLKCCQWVRYSGLSGFPNDILGPFGVFRG